MTAGEGKTVRVADIGGLAEVCEAIGFTDGYVTLLLADSSTGFPQPITPIKAGRLWDLAEVRAWKAAWNPRRPGRPTKIAVDTAPVSLSAERRAVVVDNLLGHG